MNHSIHSADRSTHLKIVVVALFAGIVVTALGISARTNAEGPVSNRNSRALKTPPFGRLFYFGDFYQNKAKPLNQWRERRDSNPRPPP